MAIAYDATTVNAETTAANPSFNHTPSGTPRGVLVVITADLNTPVITAVTYGGDSMAEVSGSPHVKATGETMATQAFFLGTGIKTGTQTVACTGSSGSNRSIACYTVTAAADTEVQNTDTSINSDSLGSPTGTLALSSSTCFVIQAAGSGANGATGTISALSGWTEETEVDFGSQLGAHYRYNTIGSADVTIGWNLDTGPNDDALGLAVAIKESVGMVIPVPLGPVW